MQFDHPLSISYDPSDHSLSINHSTMSTYHIGILARQGPSRRRESDLGYFDLGITMLANP